MTNKIKKTLQTVLSDLKHLEPYVYHEAFTTNSVYVKFKDGRLRSLRMSDHNGYDKYRYKWNIGSHIKKMYMSTDDGVKRFYYPLNNFGTIMFIKRIQQYYDVIKLSEIKVSGTTEKIVVLTDEEINELIKSITQTINGC